MEYLFFNTYLDPAAIVIGMIFPKLYFLEDDFNVHSYIQCIYSLPFGLTVMPMNDNEIDLFRHQ